MAKFLLVEDDPAMAVVIVNWFTVVGHVVEHAGTGEDALQLLNNFEYDLIILDWTLPGMSGVEVCHQFRQTGGLTPVIFTTARGDVESKERALDFGGDDYLVKPYNVRELAARIRAVMRRPIDLLRMELKVGDLILNPELRLASARGRDAHLMPKESALLEFLLRHPNHPYTADDLLNAVWPSEKTVSVESVRSWIKTLRRKLASIGEPDLIKTIRSTGYLIESDTGITSRVQQARTLCR